MKSRSYTEAIRAYAALYDELTAKGPKPLFQTMDNKASAALKTFLTSHKMKLQLIPQHIHRQNTAERAIQTFKNHFIAGICSTDKQFPLHLWDRPTPFAIITLNLLQQSRINPKLSAYAQLNVPFDSNQTPITPPGSKVILHKKTRQQKTWAPPRVNGFYFGPVMDHYQCHHVYCTATRQERIVDTIGFMPQHCKVPGFSSANVATVAATDPTTRSCTQLHQRH
jgi:hypothetical protein